MSKGFIPIRRTLFDHFLFKETRVFSRFEAWLDLIQMASFKDENSDIIGGKLVTKDRGEIVASLRYLMTRWGWSMHKVCDYLELLRSQDMVVVDKENGITKIMLLNFERHNSVIPVEKNEKNSKRNTKRNTETLNSVGLHENEGAVKGTEKGTLREQRGNSEGTNSNEENKDNDLKKDNSKSADALSSDLSPFIKRQKEFGKQLAPFVSQYSKQMIREFYDYWSEPNKSKTKMKYELEVTWDLGKRLIRWSNNQDKFNKGKTEPQNGANVNDKIKAAFKNNEQNV